MNTPRRNPPHTPPARHGRALGGWLAAVCWPVLCAAAAAAAPAADLAPTLHWDLTYRTALRDHPIPANEFIALWAASLPAGRPITATLKQYTGAPVEAALLIEKPDGHAGDPLATWFVKTTTTAQVCTVHPKVGEHCDPLDPARTEAFVRAVMRMRAPQPVAADEPKGPSGPNGPILLGYHAMLSAWADGHALQRPVAAIEFNDLALELHQMGQPGAGQLSDAIDAIVQTPQGQRERQVAKTQLQQNDALLMAIRDGDTDALRRLLDGGAQADTDDEDRQPLAAAVAFDRRAAVDLLLQRGARIDAHGGQALRVAVQNRKTAMVEYLLAKGARPDPAPGRDVFETPLAAAVGLHDRALAQLLIRHGADPNAPQAHLPLATAATTHDLPMMDLLLGAGARPDGTDADGRTALMLLMRDSGDVDGARARAHPLPPATAALVERIVRRLVAAGADVNTTSRACDNALSTAIAYHADAMVTLLRSLGADPQRQAACQAARNTTRR